MFRNFRYFKIVAIVFIATFCLSFLIACEGKDELSYEEEVSHDFTREFYRSKLHLVLDYMEFDHSAKTFLGEGWSSVEKKDSNGDSYIWSEGKKSVIKFYVVEKKDLNVIMRCAPLPANRQQNINIEINGIYLRKLSLHNELGSYEFIIPEEYLMLGLNRMTFTYAYNLTPKSLGINDDVRKLAVKFYSIDFNKSLDNYTFFNGRATIIKEAMNVSRISIDGDMKLVLIQMPKSAIKFDKCYIPPNSELKFSLGFHPKAVKWTEDVTFSIFVEEFTPYNDKIAEEIFSVTLNPKKNKKDRPWRDYTVDLSDYAGEVLSFSFNVLANADPENIFCAWGEPKIYSKVEEPKYNVILITMDALKRDHVSCYGYKKNTTILIQLYRGHYPLSFRFILLSFNKLMALKRIKNIHLVLN